MTDVFITVDTELSPGSFKRGVSLETNIAQSVFGECAEGAFGIRHKIARLNANRLTAVFFVDPMPAAVFGLDMLRRVVSPILDAGHEVQLHVHAEWLPYLERSPVVDRCGRDMRDFEQEDQERLIEFAAELLVGAGAPMPIAFRAGNYSADDRTLRALAANGIRYDTSFNPSYAGGACSINLPPEQMDVCEHCGVVEVPISAIREWHGRLRHAQLCALSDWEMGAGLRHAVHQKQSCFTIVSHSFELLTRDRRRANHTNVRRFDRLCELLAALRDEAPTIGFASRPAPVATATARPFGENALHTAHRYAEQLLSTWLYERKLWKGV